MDIPASNLPPLAKNSAVVLPQLVELLDGVSELAQLSKPEQSPENIHVQELWLIRKLVILQAAVWNHRRPQVITQIADLEAACEAWENDDAIPIPRLIWSLTQEQIALLNATNAQLQDAIRDLTEVDRRPQSMVIVAEPMRSPRRVRQEPSYIHPDILRRAAFHGAMIGVLIVSCVLWWILSGL